MINGTVGLIVEYNPLHNGHAYHYQRSLEISKADAVIAVMSGNFLQRGEPAVVNKWARAEMALRLGIDLVIELPVLYASQPAEWFAYGAVSALDATGVVDHICFGSESGDIEGLLCIAEHLHNEPDSFRLTLKEALKSGTSYPEAYSLSVARWFELQQLKLPEDFNPEQLAQPNNSLGFHYIMALKRLNSAIKPLTISRTKAGYNQADITDASIASATALRNIIMQRKELEAIAPFVPASTLDILRREWDQGQAPIHWDRYLKQLLQHIISRSPDELRQIYEVNEGLEHRLKSAIHEFNCAALNLGEPFGFEKLLETIKTKRYTRTKLQRTLLRILLNHSKAQITKDTLYRGVNYLRILGFSDKGRALLKRMKHTAKVPIITNVNRDNAAMLELDLQASSVYALGYPQIDSRKLLQDYYQSPLKA